MILTSVVLLILGFLFMLLATVGMLRFPDFFMRMAAVSKASTLGLVLMLMGAGFAHNSTDTWWKVGATAVIFFMSAPISAHLLGRAAYRRKVPLFGMRRDDYNKHQDL